MAEKKTERLFVVDFLNVISCVAVVWMHVNGAVWEFSYSKTWVAGWLLETLLFWAAPMFFMLTGITLLNYRKRYDTKMFIKKRMVKTLIPFLCWSVISIFWAIHISGTLPVDTEISFISVLDMILNCKGMEIYWFFPAIFSVYLSIPIISLVEEGKRYKVYSYVLIYGLSTVCVLPFLLGLFGVYFNPDLKSPICSGYLIYTLLGYMLWNTNLSKKKRLFIYLLGILGWGMRFFGGWYFSYQSGVIDGRFNFYLNVPCVLQSVAVFVLCKQANSLCLKKKFGETVRNGFRMLSGLSFGVYLVHFYVMRFVIDFFQIEMSAWQWRLGGGILIYFFTVIIVAVLKKIPMFSCLVP